MIALKIAKGLLGFLLTAKTNRPGSTGFAVVGGDGVEDYDAMERGLKAHGYPSAESSSLMVGGGGYSQLGHWIVGGQGEGGGSSAEDAHLLSRVSAGAGGMLVGWLLINSAWLRVYPLLVLGGRGSNVSVMPKNHTSRGVRVGTGGANVVIGIGIELRLPLSRGFKPMIGAQVGWMWNPSPPLQGDLSIDPAELGERKTSAPFVRMLIGVNTG